MVSTDADMADRVSVTPGFLDGVEELGVTSDVAQGLLSVMIGAFVRCGGTLDLQVEPHVDDAPVLFKASFDVSDDLAWA